MNFTIFKKFIPIFRFFLHPSEVQKRKNSGSGIGKTESNTVMSVNKKKGILNLLVKYFPIPKNSHTSDKA